MSKLVFSPRIYFLTNSKHLGIIAVHVLPAILKIVETISTIIGLDKNFTVANEIRCLEYVIDVWNSLPSEPEFEKCCTLKETDLGQKIVISYNANFFQKN